MRVLRFFPLYFLLLLAASSACALEPSKYLSQYAHTAWRIEGGYFGGMPNVITQTADGYLWIGTQAGLLRFDGVRFVPWAPPDGKQLPSSAITSLLGARDGSLWIGTDGGGVSHWANGTLINFPEPALRINVIVEDHLGNIWIARSVNETVDATGPICQIAGERMKCYGQKDGVTDTNAVSLVEDAVGNLWIGSHTLTRWKPGAYDTFKPRGLNPNFPIYVSGTVNMPDGSVLVGIAAPGPGRGLQELKDGDWKPFVGGALDGGTLAVTALFRDRENALWIGTMDRGLYRFYGGRVDHFRSQDGLSGDSVYCFYEDHEGNLWVATTGGVDSFRDLSVTTFSTREGLGSGEADSVLAARDGTVWIGGAGSLDALREGRISSIRERKGLPGNQVTSLLEDHAGRLWVGLDNTLSIYRNGRFDRIAMPDGSPIGLVVGLAEDMTNDIWAEVRGSPRKLVRIQDLKVQEVFPAPETPPARRVAADQKRGVWLGLMNGDLAQIRSGNLEVFPFNYGPRPMKHSDVNQLLVTSDGSILGATAFGLVAWVSGKRQILTVQNGLPCDQIFGLVADNQQNLWLYTQCGLIEVARTDLQAWQDNPGIKVRYRLFDVFDGVQPGNAPFAPAVKSPDGRLWFVNGSVLQMIDPAHLKKNTIPPPVHVEEIVADGKSYSPIDGVRLPPHPHNTEIDYTALSFVAVRNVRFRYKLEGYDTVWAEPGTRRQAFYNLLRPGRYRFRVIGCNNDGVWNDVGASLNFDVLPAWYQTNSFRSFCAMSGFIVVWCLYKLRVSRIARAIGARFEERLAERTRLARELHDTFLQTIQGSKMVADNALKHSADTARIHRAVEDLSVWLGQAMCEARTALHSLRTTDRSDLVETLQQATESDLLPSPMAVTFSVHGDVKEMDPMVHDEVYCIAYEAIRNACRHSGASRLEVQLNYARDLTLRLTDDGIGIEPKIVAAGRWGHFGLQGMRERAIRIRSKLTIDSSAKSGTGITLVVPGSVAFRKASANWRTATPWGCGYRRALLAKIRNLLGLEE